MSEAPGTPPAEADRLVTRFVLRTVLLVLSIALLFPTALDWLGQGAWARFVFSLGAGRWIVWGACFVAMTLMRFAGGPKRGA